MADQEHKGAWRVTIDAASLDGLRSQPLFRDMVLLSRATNAVRFALAAGMQQGSSETVTANRQRVGSYFYLAAVLEEALRLTERIGRTLHRFDEWNGLAELRKASSTQSLRGQVLERLRNQAVFHNDDEVAIKGLALLKPGAYIVAQGDTSSLLDVRYTLAEYAAIAFAIDGFAPLDGHEPFASLLRATTALASDFLVAADSVLGQVANTLGLEVEDLPSPAERDS